MNDCTCYLRRNCPLRMMAFLLTDWDEEYNLVRRRKKCERPTHVLHPLSVKTKNVLKGFVLTKNPHDEGRVEADADHGWSIHGPHLEVHERQAPSQILMDRNQDSFWGLTVYVPCERRCEQTDGHMVQTNTLDGPLPSVCELTKGESESEESGLETVPDGMVAKALFCSCHGQTTRRHRRVTCRVAPCEQQDATKKPTIFPKLHDNDKFLYMFSSIKHLTLDILLAWQYFGRKTLYLERTPNMPQIFYFCEELRWVVLEKGRLGRGKQNSWFPCCFKTHAPRWFRLPCTKTEHCNSRKTIKGQTEGLQALQRAQI